MSKPSPDRIGEIVENFIFDHRSLDGAGLLASDYAISTEQEDAYEKEQFEDIIKLIKLIKQEALRMSLEAVGENESILAGGGSGCLWATNILIENRNQAKDEIRQELRRVWG